MDVETPFDLILCNGESPDPELAKLLAGGARFICCADGGANTARALGIVPDHILGDLDSISEETRLHFLAQEVPIERMSGQSDTDLEKCLHWSLGVGARRVVILGATGGLLDHTFGNFSILTRHARDLRIVLFDSHQRIDLLSSSEDVSVRIGDRISIVPMTPVEGLTYAGLQYPLRGVRLVFGEREGTCNTAIANRIHIEFSRGIVALFRPWRISELGEHVFS